MKKIDTRKFFCLLLFSVLANCKFAIASNSFFNTTKEIEMLPLFKKSQAKDWLYFRFAEEEYSPGCQITVANNEKTPPNIIKPSTKQDSSKELHLGKAWLIKLDSFFDLCSIRLLLWVTLSGHVKGRWSFLADRINRTCKVDFFDVKELGKNKIDSKQAIKIKQMKLEKNETFSFIITNDKGHLLFSTTLYIPKNGEKDYMQSLPKTPISAQISKYTLSKVSSNDRFESDEFRFSQGIHGTAKTTTVLRGNKKSVPSLIKPNVKQDISKELTPNKAWKIILSDCFYPCGLELLIWITPLGHIKGRWAFMPHQVNSHKKEYFDVEVLGNKIISTNDVIDLKDIVLNKKGIFSFTIRKKNKLASLPLFHTTFHIPQKAQHGWLKSLSIVKSETTPYSMIKRRKIFFQTKSMILSRLLCSTGLLLSPSLFLPRYQANNL